MTIILGLIMLAFIVSGIIKGIKQARKPKGGWLYFAAGRGTPVMVKVSDLEPTSKDLPDYANPLRILFKTKVTDKVAAVKALHDDIGEHQVSPGWFERDAANYYIDHLRGAV